MSQITPFHFRGQVPTNAFGMRQIAEFYQHCLPFQKNVVPVSFDGVEFFDANLASPLLALVHKLKKENQLTFRTDYATFGGNHLGVLHRNGFAKYFCGLPWDIIDDRASTIPIRAFKVDDVDEFVRFIERDVFRHRGLYSLKHETTKKLKDSYFEIFGNVDLHANTQYPVIACGQYFPAQKELKFTITDLGEGFLSKIALQTAQTDTPITLPGDAIAWAVKGGTTKQEAPGGTGLLKILGYCRKNNGSLHICTDGYYWSFDGSISGQKIAKNLPGSSITLIFRNL